MADCYYHGYSGGPGPCLYCDQEDKAGEERGSSKDGYDMSVTTHDWQHGRMGRIGQPGNPNG